MNNEKRVKILRPYRRIDLSGRQFGKLKVVSFSHSDRFNHTIWHCHCSCGNTTLADSGSLKSGKKSSCGCIGLSIGNQSRTWKGHGEISKVFFDNIQKHAQQRKRPFEISIEYIWDLFLKQNKKCAYSGRDLQFPTRRGDKTGTASLDRIDSSKGYIKNNIQWVHKTVNAMKTNLSEQDFLMFCGEIASYKSLDKSTKAS